MQPTATAPPTPPTRRRVAVGGIVHETNTFAPATPLDAFELTRGDDLIRAARGTRTFTGGMLDGLTELDAHVVGLLDATAQPAGAITHDAYRALLGELLARLDAAGPLDAVLLALHGAGMAEGLDSIETHLTRAVRDHVGPDVPVVITLDLHGNLHPELARNVDLMFGVEEYPHIDAYERGLEAARSLQQLWSGAWRPVIHIERVPMLLPPSVTTHPDAPAARANALCRHLERELDLIDCTLFHGFPYTDVPHMSVTVVVTTHDDAPLARRAAATVADWLWTHRDEFLQHHPTPEEAVRLAETLDGPVVINDTADNSGGGAPGDGTHLLHALLAHSTRPACLAGICDPQLAAQAHRAGVGAHLDVAIGGKTDALHGPPVHARAYVKTLTDGRFQYQGPLGQGAWTDVGPTARLQLGHVDVIVTSRREQTYDTEMFQQCGVDVTRYHTVVVKSSMHFRAAYEPIARHVVTADSPGLTSLDLLVFTRTRTPALWPVDPTTPRTPEVHST